MVQPHQLDGIAAFRAAELTTMGKTKGERDTEFVKRIVCAYLNAVEDIKQHGRPVPHHGSGPDNQ